MTVALKQWCSGAEPVEKRRWWNGGGAMTGFLGGDKDGNSEQGGRK